MCIRLTDENRVLYFNEEYRPPFYGHVSLINLKEHLISPFTTGYEGTAIESLYPSNTDMFRLAREQGALGAYVHPFWGDEDPLDTNLGNAKGLPVDVALETVDYHELHSGAGWAAYDVWHHVLNNGFKLPAVGGEDAISGLHDTAIIGQMRAYAYMPDGLSWENWIRAIREGALFVTNGPLVRLKVDGFQIGETVELQGEGGERARRRRHLFHHTARSDRTRREWRRHSDRRATKRRHRRRVSLLLLARDFHYSKFVDHFTGCPLHRHPPYRRQLSAGDDQSGLGNRGR